MPRRDRKGFLKRTLERGTEVTATGEASKSIQRAVRGLDGRMTLYYYYFFLTNISLDALWKVDGRGRDVGI